MRDGLLCLVAAALLVGACGENEPSAPGDAGVDAPAPDAPLPDAAPDAPGADASPFDCEGFCLGLAPPCGGSAAQCEANCACWVARWRPSAVSSVMGCVTDLGACGADDYAACFAAAASQEPRPSGLSQYLEACEANVCSFDRDACDGEFLRVYAEGTVDALDDCLRYVCDSVSDCVDGVLFCR